MVTGVLGRDHRVPAEDLVLAGREYWIAGGALDTLRDSQSQLNTPAELGELPVPPPRQPQEAGPDDCRRGRLTGQELCVAPVFEHQVSVRWRDTDALGHVNHAVYLTYLEEARDAFYLRTLGDPVYVVARLEIDFRAEVRHADRTVRAQIAVEQLGRTSLTTRETLRTPDGAVAAEARVITVHWDQEVRAAVPFSDEQRALLAEYVG